MRYTIFLLLLVLSNLGFSQSCLPEGIIFYDQDDIDNFINEFPNCTEILGNVTIGKCTTEGTICNISEITNLNGLSSLTAIGGNLSISKNEILSSLDGLNNLESIGGNLFFSQNPLIQNMDALANLSTLEGTLSISSGDNMLNVDSLANLNSLGGIRLYNNPILQNLDGLSNITSITTAGIEVSLCHSLPNLNPLENLTNFTGPIVINQNDLLESINGLSNISIPALAEIRIHDNPLLMSIQALSGFEYISGDLRISSNESLTSLAGLHNLDSIGGDFIMFDNNSLLTVDDLLNLTRVGESLTLSGASLANINGLSNLTQIGKDFTISNNVIPTLAGLQNLLSVGKDLKLNGCDSLTDISALSNLNTIGLLFLKDNSVLTDLTGLHNIASTNTIWIENNDALMDLNQFSNLTNLAGSIFIFENDILNDISGLSNISQPINNQYIAISNNPRLQSLNGLQSISNITVQLIIEGNTDLTNLEGLNSVDSIMGDCFISNNENLQHLRGLDNLVFIGNELRILENPNLLNVEGIEQLSNVGNNLLIKDNSNLLSLSGMENIISVGRDLIIERNESLITVDQLENLTTVNGNFKILLNNGLLDIMGVNMLDSVGKDLVIQYNTIANSISGFNSLNFINEDFLIKDNNNIPLLAGFNSLSTVSNDMIISNNIGLTTINGLGELQAVGGALYFDRNHSLTTLSGFNNLSTIGEGLGISQNDNLETVIGFNSLVTSSSFVGASFNQNLTEITGFNNLQSVGSLSFRSNENLTEINGFSSLQFIGESLWIIENTSLSNCSLLSFCNFLTAGGESFIIDNAEGCNEVEEIIEACVGLSFSGHTFYDFNLNQEHDLNEGTVAMQRIAVSPDGVTLFTNQNGKYLYTCEEGETYNFAWQDNSDWELTTDSASYTTVFEPFVASNHNNNFGISPNFVSHAHAINLTSQQLRCNTDVDFYVQVCNEGTFLENDNGTVTVEYNEFVEYVSALPIPMSINEEDRTITWSTGNFYPWTCRNYKIIFAMPGVDNLGENVELTTQVYRDSLGVPLLAADHFFSSEVLCSYDPNDKQVAPAGVQEDNFTLKEENLSYTLRFQNTGNIEAIDVILRDTLDTDLDWNTFQVVQASHPVFTALSQEGALEFYFKDIYLPDSTSDPQGSQGLVQYTIDPLAGLPDYTAIENTAFIYFDQNPPIVTNTTINTLVDEIPSPNGTVELKKQWFDIYPNPTTGIIQLVSDPSLDKRDYTWQIHTATGQILKTNLTTSNQTIDLSAYPNGLYIVQLREKSSGLTLGMKRLVVFE